MSRALRAALQKLTDAADGLPASQLTRAQQQALNEFANRTRAVGVQRQGRGNIYLPHLPDVIAQMLAELAPLAATKLNDLPQRAANIGAARASKSAAHRHDLSYLLLKAKGQVIWENDQGQTLDLAAATQQQGAACLAIGGDAGKCWHSEQSLWLVENQEVFDQLEWLPDTRASVLWYAGQLSNLLIDWLAEQPRASKLWLFPDYDGVGLANYARLKQRLGDGVELWLMPHWQQKLMRYGNNIIWQDTWPQFQSALTQLQPWLATDARLTELVTRLQRTGLALEQEAVWLPL